jgi:3-oxoacyl-[acyl-carrier-protein] synthase II
MKTDRQVVVTGLGAVSPLGLDVEHLWQGLLEGKCGIDTIKSFDPSGFPCKLAGEVEEFKVRKHVPKSFRKSTKLMCRDIELSVLAANEAFESSGLVTKAKDPDNVTVDPTRVAINFGANVISCDLEEIAPSISVSSEDGKFDVRKWGTDGLQALTPLWLLKYLPNMLACHVGIIHDVRGPSNSITCGEAGAHIAIAEAAQVIIRDDADVALAGGGESKVNALMMTRQCLNDRATTENNDNPETACRPFDADAKGSIFGEGAGMLVLEEKQFAEKRGAKILAELAGFGESNNINSAFNRLEPEAKGTQIAIEMALEDAGISADQIDLIIPHGTGIPQDDLAEATAINNALGEAAAKAIVLPTKSMLSNTASAAGALDLITAIMAMQTSTVPAAKNCGNKAAGCNLNISDKQQQKQIRYALCTSYTYGGQTAAVIVKNPNL